MSKGIRPSLFDRLGPGGGWESLYAPPTSQVGDSSGTGSKSELESVVERDLNWLFNTVSPLSCRKDLTDAVGKCRRVRDSVLNFGLLGSFGRIGSGEAALRILQETVSKAIATFEPRLSVHSKTVRVTPSGAVVEVKLEGTLVDLDAASSLEVKVNLQTMHGDLKLTRAGGG